MHDLGIKLGGGSRSEWSPGRELTPSDVMMLDAASAEPPKLRKLTQRHHALARTLASGMAPGEAAILCDYTPVRVAQLQRDSAFRELIAFYQKRVEEVYIDRHTALANLSTDAVLTLHGRLEDEPEAFSNRELTELSKMALDRTGIGPSTTQVNVNVDIATRMAAARARLAKEKSDELG